MMLILTVPERGQAATVAAAAVTAVPVSEPHLFEVTDGKVN